MEYTPRINDNMLTARAAAAGSMVLLKNVRNTLPLAPENGEPVRVAVFGIGQIYTACVPVGMTPWRTVSILDGLCANRDLVPDGLLSHKYRSWALEHPDHAPMPLGSLQLDEFSANNDAALVVISREAGSADPQLTEEELQMIRTVCVGFPRTALILNTPGYMELGEAAQLFGAIVFMGIAGQEAGHALADLLTGAIVPAGRLAFSWPTALSDFDRAAEQADGFIGYRWFDSFGAELLYPFGYGLNYGKAELTSYSAGLDGCDVVVSAEITNTGERFPVQEVVQVYVSLPNAKKDAPVWILDCFAKTRVLEVGESQTLQLRFPITECSVFREESCAYVLEEGYYDIRVGTSSRSTGIAGSIRLTRSAVVQAHAPMQMTGPKNRQFTAPCTYPGEAEELESAHRKAIRFSDRNLPRRSKKKGSTFAGCRSDGSVHTLQELRRGECTPFQLIGGMDDHSLQLLVNDFGSLTSELPGAVGASPALERYGIPALNIAAGSCGLCLEKDIPDENDKIVGHRFCTAFPAPSLLACSFDPDLIRSVGAGIGREMAEFGVDLWLAPGADLQRSPRQTHFWECWSEDPVLSGICAMSMADGVRPYGAPILRAADAKSGDLSQRAFRDLYGLSFEIASHAYPVMLIPEIRLCGELPGEDGKLMKSVIVDWKYTGMFLADNERYVSEPDRVTLEKTALRMLKVLQNSKKA